VRIRLNSTAVSVSESNGSVDVQYVTGNKLYRVRGKLAVMACWNMAIPFICPQLPSEQKTALGYGAKVPLVYTVVALRNWRAFSQLKVKRIESPGMYHSSMYLDDAVDIGGYRSPRTLDQPILLRMLRTPCKPGLSERDQHRVGRYDLLTTTFATFEQKIRDQLARTLSGSAFKQTDIKGITVNRWPHGYAYEYNALFDPDWPKGQRPCDIARRQFGRIAIANSDAAAAAYTDQAIDQAYRAINELLSV
jgi:spermidine dehydrogenase